MSNIVLSEGKDTAIRRIAQMMIQKQNIEIADLIFSTVMPQYGVQYENVNGKNAS